MTKNKLFYIAFACFFIINNTNLALAEDFAAEDKAKMLEIIAHNNEQKKNVKDLRSYQEEHTDNIKPKEDEYWNMAWHARLADYGDSESQFVIAKAYEEGKNVEVNLKKALAFYKKAADGGHIEAAMNLGRIYSENKWLKADQEKEIYWYLKAANNNYVPAQLKVANLYEKNENFEQAYKWYEKAIQNMFPEEKNLEERSPDLKRISLKIKEKKETNG